MPLQPPDVVKIALEYLQKVSPDASKFINVRLEELQKDTDGAWLVTLSYEVVGEFPFDKKKEYKDFKVTDGVKEDGDNNVVWMKIRKV